MLGGRFRLDSELLVVGTRDGVNGRGRPFTIGPSAETGSSVSVFASAVFAPVTTIASTAATTPTATSAIGPPIASARFRLRRRSASAGRAGGAAAGGGG